MPRFFFHIRDGIAILDEIGTEFAGLEQARAEAVRAAAEALRDLGPKFWDSPEWRMWVTDEGGRTVCALRFSAEEHQTPAHLPRE